MNILVSVERSVLGKILNIIKSFRKKQLPQQPELGSRSRISILYSPGNQKKKSDLRKACCFGTQWNAIAFVHIEWQLVFYKWLMLVCFQEALEILRVGSTLQLSNSTQNQDLGGIHGEYLLPCRALENVSGSKTRWWWGKLCIERCQNRYKGQLLVGKNKCIWAWETFLTICQPMEK